MDELRAGAHREHSTHREHCIHREHCTRPLSLPLSPVQQLPAVAVQQRESYLGEVV